MNSDNFDELIKMYSEELLKMDKLYGGEADRALATLPKTENEEILPKEESNAAEVLTAPQEAEMSENEPKIKLSEGESAVVNTEPAVNSADEASTKDEATSFSSFSARVFSGEGTYPVEGARVVVYREDNIFAFLETDENGATKTVQLPAFKKENSLESENPDQTVDYFADVFAEGFISQKALLVSSVGGSEILLRVLMVPDEERIG